MRRPLHRATERRAPHCQLPVVGAVGLIIVGLAGCGAGSQRRAGPQVIAGCPLTHAGEPRPPAVALQNFGTPMGRSSDPGWFGNGTVWTHLPAPNQSLRDPKTGLIYMKFPWFRARPGAFQCIDMTRERGSGARGAQT